MALAVDLIGVRAWGPPLCTASQDDRQIDVRGEVVHTNLQRKLPSVQTQLAQFKAMRPAAAPLEKQLPQSSPEKVLAPWDGGK
jgi:hypothetical protein